MGCGRRYHAHPRRFLEVGAGVGLPSLIARRLGFQVVSTDLVESTAWSRRAGARLSFGDAGALEIHTLNLTDAASWGAAASGGRFDVVAVGINPASQLQELGPDFRELLDQVPGAAGSGCSQ